MTFRLEGSHLFAMPRSDRALIAHNAGIADQEAHDTHEKMTQPTILRTSTGKKSKNSVATARQMFAKSKDADQCHDQSNGEPDNNRSAPSHLRAARRAARQTTRKLFMMSAWCE